MSRFIGAYEKDKIFLFVWKMILSLTIFYKYRMFTNIINIE